MEAFLAEFWSDFSRPENFVGHFAYVLLILSMMMRNMNWLRFFAIMAGSISAFFYFTIGDVVSMFWESMFTLVNLAQFMILQVENRRGKFTDDEEMFIAACLGGVERAYARRLCKLGAWIEVQEDVTLITEDTCPKQLVFLVSGEASVSRKGKEIGVVRRGDFLGEMSYLTGQQATATVVTRQPTRYLAFERDILKAHLEKSVEVRHALEASFNRNLVAKLVNTNQGRLNPVG
jgi:hypothetical protein